LPDGAVTQKVSIFKASMRLVDHPLGFCIGLGTDCGLKDETTDTREIESYWRRRRFDSLDIAACMTTTDGDSKVYSTPEYAAGLLAGMKHNSV